MTKSETDPLIRARELDQQVSVLGKLVIPMAKAALADEPKCLKRLAQLGEQCRQIGEISVAAEIYGAIAEMNDADSFAVSLNNILNGSFSDDPMVAPDRPAPFVHVPNFSSGELHAALVSQTQKDIKLFGQAGVLDKGQKASYDNSLRHGSVLGGNEMLAYKELFLPTLKTSLVSQNILHRLGIAAIEGLRYEVQVTNYTDGGFFCKHIDASSKVLQSRIVSYVYYFRREPSSFSGGDLILYDHGENATGYTRVRPLDNSIVFFLGTTLHEVLPVFVDSGNPKDGRFTVNGWLHGKQATT